MVITPPLIRYLWCKFNIPYFIVKELTVDLKRKLNYIDKFSIIK